MPRHAASRKPFNTPGDEVSSWLWPTINGLIITTVVFFVTQLLAQIPAQWQFQRSYDPCKLKTPTLAGTVCKDNAAPFEAHVNSLASVLALGVAIVVFMIYLRLVVKPKPKRWFGKLLMSQLLLLLVIIVVAVFTLVWALVAFLPPGWL